MSYLPVDTTALNGRFRGQLVAASAIGYNWLFPDAYGVLEIELAESWTWFLQNLWQVIGFPDGLAIHIDACKFLETTVEDVFPGVELREWMRHLAAHFKLQGFKGQLFDDNLWPASLTYSLKKHNYHLTQMYTKHRVKTYMDNHHRKVWVRSKFNEACKVDYVNNNNLAESFNSWIRKIKGLHLVDMLNKIRQMLMVKFELHQRIASQKFVGHKIIPMVMKTLHAKTRGL
jgi:hypothetical protein